MPNDLRQSVAVQRIWCYYRSMLRLTANILERRTSEQGPEADIQVVEPNGDAYVLRVLCRPETTEVGESGNGAIITYLTQKYGAPEVIQLLRRLTLGQAETGQTTQVAGAETIFGQMRYGTVTGIDKPVSRLVQGTIQIAVNDDALGFAQMDAAWEAGVNCLDTAAVYGGGANDKFVGRWMKARDNRDKVVVLAKGAHHNDLRKRVTPYDIGSDLHDTLARMQTPYIDLYVLHRDDPDYPVEPIIDALNGYVREGKIRAFGASNWTSARIAAANAYAIQSNQMPFVASSPHFSLADQHKSPWEGCVSISGPSRAAERDVYRSAYGPGLPLFTWSSMAGGFLSGRFTRDNLGEFSSYFDKLAVECYASEANFQRLDRASEIAKLKGLTVPQIALSYVLSYPLNIFAIVGSATQAEIESNVQALNTTLTPRELGYLDLSFDTLD